MIKTAAPAPTFPMHFVARIFLLVAVLAGPGCVTFKPEELAEFRAHNVPPAVYRKLTDREVITPPDIVELWQRKVPQPLIEKQLDKIGVDYAFTKTDLALLTRAGVPQGVIDALMAASERFVTRYAPPDFFETNNFDSDEYLVNPGVRNNSGAASSSELRLSR